MLKPVILFSKYPVIYGLFFVALVGLLPMSCSDAQAKEEAIAEAASKMNTVMARAETGEELFSSYCQICHGTGDEKGPMAELLTVPVPDLRYISARRAGSFPAEDLTKIIAGNADVKGHGGASMPIWGKTFMQSEALENEEQVSKRIDMLVQYLKTMQEDMPAETES